jgi:hypothetical protein
MRGKCGLDCCYRKASSTTASRDDAKRQANGTGGDGTTSTTRTTVEMRKATMAGECCGEGPLLTCPVTRRRVLAPNLTSTRCRLRLFRRNCSMLVSDGIESHSCVWAVHDGEALHTSSSAMHSCTEFNSDFENHYMHVVHKLHALCASLPYDVTALPGASAIAGRAA